MKSTFRKEVEERWKPLAMSQSRVRLSQLVEERMSEHFNG